jgi:hypothetical protein
LIERIDFKISIVNLFRIHAHQLAFGESLGKDLLCFGERCRDPFPKRKRMKEKKAKEGPSSFFQKDSTCPHGFIITYDSNKFDIDFPIWG